MYWYERPPWLRWAAAAVIVAAALVYEFAPRPEERRPFAARTVAAGTLLTDADIEWRDVPAGLLPAADLSLATAVALRPGDPIVASVLTAGPSIPEGWWSVPLPLPPEVAPGTAARLITGTAEEWTDGVVISPPVADPYAPTPTGQVAVPEAAAARIAAAAASGDVVVLLEP